MVYDDYIFETLLGRDLTFSKNHKIMQYLLEIIFKVDHRLADNGILKHISKITTNYNLRLQAYISIPSVNSTYKGINLLTYCGAVIWNSLAVCLRIFKLLPEFKVSIKNGNF